MFVGVLFVAGFVRRGFFSSRVFFVWGFCVVSRGSLHSGSELHGGGGGGATLGVRGPREPTLGIVGQREPTRGLGPSKKTRESKNDLLLLQAWPVCGTHLCRPPLRRKDSRTGAAAPPAGVAAGAAAPQPAASTTPARDILGFDLLMCLYRHSAQASRIGFAARLQHGRCARSAISRSKWARGCQRELQRLWPRPRRCGSATPARDILGFDLLMCLYRHSAQASRIRFAARLQDWRAGTAENQTKQKLSPPLLHQSSFSNPKN